MPSFLKLTDYGELLQYIGGVRGFLEGIGQIAAGAVADLVDALLPLKAT